MSMWIEQFDDAQVAFVMRVLLREKELAHRSLQAVRAAFPRSPVFLVSDGEYEADWSPFARGFGAEYWVTPRLFGREHGGRLISQELELWRQAGTRWLFKIDPDTMVWRRPWRMPAEMGLWGTLQRAGPLLSLQGGCVLYAGGADAFASLHQLVLDRRLAQSPETTWAVTPLIQQRLARGLMSEDWVRGWAAMNSDTPQREHAEILSRWTEEPSRDPALAITHPHKRLVLPPG